MLKLLHTLEPTGTIHEMISKDEITSGSFSAASYKIDIIENSRLTQFRRFLRLPSFMTAASFRLHSIDQVYDNKFDISTSVCVMNSEALLHTRPMLLDFYVSTPPTFLSSSSSSSSSSGPSSSTLGLKELVIGSTNEELSAGLQALYR